MSVPTTTDAGGVFLSWTRADTDRDGVLGRLVKALRSAGVPVWIDDSQIGPFDPIPDAVREGLSRSKVLLAWYSKEYPTRRACREELTLALLAAENSGQGDRRVLVINPETSLNHVLEARLLDRRFATGEDMENPAILADRIKKLVNDLTSTFGSLPVPGPARWYGGLGWEGSSRRFIGRLTELWKVHDFLHRTTGLAGAGEAGRSVALVSGFGGVGKSLLAAEYAHLFASRYPGGVVWLSAAGHDPTGATLTAEQSKAAADTAIAEVAGFLNMDRSEPADLARVDPPTLREWIKSELRRRGTDVLWVVDDVATGLDAGGLDAWRCPGPTVHELITTRDAGHSRFPAIDLDVLQPADALGLLTQGRPLPPSEHTQAAALAAELGYHPLACDVAGLYIARSTTFANYRRLLAGNIGRFDELATQLADQLPGGHAREIIATLATSLQQLGPEAWKLLRLAALLAPAPIPRTLLVDVFRQLKPTARSRRWRRSGREREYSAEDGVSAALQDRHRDGLWSYDPVSAGMSVNVLVAAAAAAIDPEPSHIKPTRDAVEETLTALFKGRAPDIRQHESLTEVAVHARHLTSADGVRNALLAVLAYYDLEAGRVGPAIALLERALTGFKRELGPDHPHTLSTMNNLATAYKDAGHWADALPLLARALDDSQRVHGPFHPDTLTIWDNLANAYLAAGRPAEAVELFEHVATMRALVLGLDHPDTLIGRANLAHGYQDSGRLADALPLFERTLADFERVLGQDHPATMTCRNNLALAYRDVGRPADALPLFEHTLNDGERLYGQDHPRTIANRTNVAISYQDMGRLPEAIRLLEGALADSERVLGPDHPDTLISRSNLAGAYQEAGRLADAVQLFENTLVDSERVEGSSHPNTLKVRNNLADAYQDADRLPEAVQLLEHTLTDSERALGADHPITLTCRANLAIAYRRAGDLARAIPLYEQTAAARERIIGGDHPDTLSSLNNLGDTYTAVGRVDDGVGLLERTLSLRERALGPDHRDTLSSRNNLGVAYHQAGQQADALQLLKRNLTERERVLGPDHPDTLTSRHNLAYAYESAGDLARAIRLYERTLADRERVLGPNHSDTLISRRKLAYAYEFDGDLARAIPLYEQTMADMERVLGPDHPDTLTSRNNLADAYREAGDLARAIPLYEQTVAEHERVLGANDSRTLTSRHKLASAVGATGDLARATPLYEQTLADLERVLGADHPDTLTLRNNFAGAYWAAGEVARAIQLYEQNLVDMERVLGPDHPDTSTSRNNLARAKQIADGMPDSDLPSVEWAGPTLDPKTGLFVAGVASDNTPCYWQLFKPNEKLCNRTIVGPPGSGKTNAFTVLAIEILYSGFLSLFYADPLNRHDHLAAEKGARRIAITPEETIEQLRLAKSWIDHRQNEGYSGPSASEPGMFLLIEDAHVVFCHSDEAALLAEQVATRGKHLGVGVIVTLPDLKIARFGDRPVLREALQENKVSFGNRDLLNEDE
jgi:tetratricopeptide (TPR) repeat protein